LYAKQTNEWMKYKLSISYKLSNNLLKINIFLGSQLADVNAAPYA
jgi:hypothetical protein